jgi:hypothetical protein
MEMLSTEKLFKGSLSEREYYGKKLQYYGKKITVLRKKYKIQILSHRKIAPPT